MPLNPETIAQQLAETPDPQQAAKLLATLLADIGTEINTLFDADLSQLDVDAFTLHVKLATYVVATLIELNRAIGAMRPLFVILRGTEPKPTHEGN